MKKKSMKYFEITPRIFIEHIIIKGDSGVVQFLTPLSSFAHMIAILLICLLILWLAAHILNGTRNEEEKTKNTKNEIEKISAQINLNRVSIINKNHN